MASEVHALPYIERITGKDDKKSVYLTRVHLTPFSWWKLPRIYIHIFSRPDEDRELHDHPWGFLTVVLFGGYDEISHKLNDGGEPMVQPGLFPGDDKPILIPDRLRWLSLRKRPATHAHKITRLHTKKVVTLVIRDNGRSREWGFWCEHRENPTSVLRYVWRLWTEYLNLPERTYEAY